MPGFPRRRAAPGAGRRRGRAMLGRVSVRAYMEDGGVAFYTDVLGRFEGGGAAAEIARLVDPLEREQRATGRGRFERRERRHPGPAPG